MKNKARGNTEVSKHLADEEHREEDIEFKIIGSDENWYRRGFIEAINIKRKPELNLDDGRINILHIYEYLIIRDERSRDNAND